tara:strand:+ start:5918 stop:6601 length:684 start_codon:yes stop_codon:yes gene_type:complete
VNKNSNHTQNLKLVSGKLILLLIILGLTLLYIIFFPMSRIPRVDLPDRICVLEDSLFFTFSDQLGQEVTELVLEDNICVISFYSADCIEKVCPTIMKELSRIQTEYIDDQEVKIISIALGQGDSLSSRQTFAKRFDAIPKKWYFLGGNLSEVKKLYYEQLAMPWYEGLSSVPMYHNDSIVLLDHLGGVRGFYDGTDSKSIDQLMADIILVQKWRKVKKKEASRKRED